MPWPESSHTAAADIAACRAELATGSRTFYAASLMLPREIRDAATALYAFCRQADDAVDLDGGRAEAVARLRLRLDRAYAGRPLARPADRALADVVVRFGVPRELPEALVEGIEWDAEGRRYEDIAGLHAYAARVAGAVGAMTAVLMGARRPETIARACDLGVAMQLTNIARDVGEDARAGRLYLPLAWMREAGIDPDAWLAAPHYSDRLAAVIRRLLARADALYARAATGIADLPAGCRPGIHAARLLYAEIGRAVERSGCDSVTVRAFVPASRKARLLARALKEAAMPPAGIKAPALPETQFLVDAVTAMPVPAIKRALPWWAFRRRAVWVVELFERLERDRRRAPMAAEDVGVPAMRTAR